MEGLIFIAILCVVSAVMWTGEHISNAIRESRPTVNLYVNNRVVPQEEESDGTD